MSDDLRERTPARDLGDNPIEPGMRSDNGASSGGAPGAQPGGGGIQDPALNVEPLTGQGTGSGGGYGTGSGNSSAGSQDRIDGSGSDIGTQTEWLRGAADTTRGGDMGSHDATREEGIASRGDQGLGAQGADQE